VKTNVVMSMGILLHLTKKLCKIRLILDDHNEFNLKVRSALFWDFTQHKLVVCYRRFGTICLQGTS